MVAFTLLGASPSFGDVRTCEGSFVFSAQAGRIQVRWRHAASENYVINQTDRLLRLEYGDRLPVEIYEAVRVQDFSLVRFDSNRISLLEVRSEAKEESRDGVVAHVRFYSASDSKGLRAVLPFFELIHQEAASTRTWRRYASLSMVHQGFGSTLQTWKRIYIYERDAARPVFEVSRLWGAETHAAELKKELSRHQRRNPGAIYFAHVKSQEQVLRYQSLLGLEVVEVFKNPRTGEDEYILSL